MIPVPIDLKENLVWWLEQGRIEKGVSLEAKKPDLMLFTDASRESWGATLNQQHVSGDWTAKEKREHINVLELKAVFYALKTMENTVKRKTIAVFSDNTTALLYIRKQGGTKSWGLFRLVEELLVWAEERNYTIAKVHRGHEKQCGRCPNQKRPKRQDRL